MYKLGLDENALFKYFIKYTFNPPYKGPNGRFCLTAVKSRKSETKKKQPKTTPFS